MNWISKEARKEPKGIIVCKGVMPAFKDDIKNLKDIKVFAMDGSSKFILGKKPNDYKETVCSQKIGLRTRK